MFANRLSLIIKCLHYTEQTPELEMNPSSLLIITESPDLIVMLNSNSCDKTRRAVHNVCGLNLKELRDML